MPPDGGKAIDTADDLYGLDPDQFVAGRISLARRLKASGDADAVRVGKLRRPPLSAWALNQVSRHQPQLIDRALAQGAALRDAMQQAAACDAAGWRDVQAAERAD